MGFELVGLTWSQQAFSEYLAAMPKPGWCQGVCLHHTAVPSLAQRPVGLTAQHMINLRDYYQVQMRWSAGPHLFVDDFKFSGMSDLRRPGVHAGKRFNPIYIAIEVLGNYDSEDPLNGRGLTCWTHAAGATARLLRWLELEPTKMTVRFHRDNPDTRKSCPGTKITKPWILGLIEEIGAGVA